MINTLTTEQYKEFTDNVQILSDKGYDLQFTADKKPESDTVDVTILGNHNMETLDALLESA